MRSGSLWVALSLVLVAVAGEALAGCSSDKSGSGTVNSSLTDCDAGDGGSCTTSESTGTTPTGGW